MTENLPAATTDQPAELVLFREQRTELWKQAQALSESQLVPSHFQKKPGDCFIMADLAMRMNVALLPLLQSSYIVHGKPGLEGKFVAALLEGSGKISGPIDYEFSGDGEQYGCVAIVFDRALQKECRGPKVDWAMVKKEGWDKPKGSQVSKWVTMPELMFHYRAAAFLVRTRYPSVLMGMNTTDELESSPLTDTQIIDAVTRHKEQIDQQRSDAPKEEAQPEEPEQQAKSDWREMLQRELDDATSMNHCEKIGEHYCSENPADKDSIVEQVERRKSVIRSSRGQRSNGAEKTQKTLEPSAM